jgi:hypothetical protein
MATTPSTPDPILSALGRQARDRADQRHDDAQRADDAHSMEAADEAARQAAQPARRTGRQ